MTLIRPIRDSTPRPPPDYREAVEKYAREYGRHASLEFAPTIGAWVVRFTLRPNDPRLGAYREGRLKEEPVEQVEIWRFVNPENPNGDRHLIPRLPRHPRTGKPMPGYAPLKLEELGVSGLIEYLERGNTWGRGEFKDHEQAMGKAYQDMLAAQRRIKQRTKDDVVHKGLDQRRQIFDIPFHRVGVDLSGTKPSLAATAADQGEDL